MRKIRSLRYLKRFAIHHTNRPQSVAEHSFFVATLCYVVAVEYNSNMPSILYVNPEKAAVYGLFHDEIECITGDIPFLFKLRNPRSFELMEGRAYSDCDFQIRPAKDEYIYIDIVEFADALEAKIYLEEERMAGNRHLFDIERETWSRLKASRLPSQVTARFLEELESMVPKEIPDILTHEGLQWGKL